MKRKQQDQPEYGSTGGYGMPSGSAGYGMPGGSSGYGMPGGSSGYGMPGGSAGSYGMPSGSAGSYGMSGGADLADDPNGRIPGGKWVFSRITLIFSIIGALLGTAVAAILNGLVLTALTSGHPGLHAVLMIGLFTALSGGGAMLGVMVSPSGPEKSRECAIWLAIGLAVLLVLGSLLQFIYSLGSQNAHSVADDFVFVIDDSGRMATSDPNNARVTAMEYLLKNLPEGKRAGMIFFTGQVDYERPLEYMTAENAEAMIQDVQYLQSMGNTCTYYALDAALDMAGVSDPNRLTEIVLLTDGYGGDLYESEILARCQSGNVRISAILMQDTSGMADTRQLADKSGGSVYEANELEELVNAYSSIGLNLYARDLLGVRTGTDHGSILLALMRVFAWALIGFAYGFCLKNMLAGMDGYEMVTMLYGPAAGLVAGIVFEVLNALWVDWNVFSVSGNAVIAALIFAAITFCYQLPCEPSDSGNDSAYNPVIPPIEKKASRLGSDKPDSGIGVLEWRR